jgi:hypothetical protein
MLVVTTSLQMTKVSTVHLSALHIHFIRVF